LFLISLFLSCFFLQAELPQGEGNEEEENDEIIEDDMNGGAGGGRDGRGGGKHGSRGTGGGGDKDVFYENDENTIDDALRLDSSIDHSTHHIIQAAIDPIAWKTELERVAPKLKSIQPLSTNEWRSHVDQTLSSKQQIEKVMTSNSGELSSINK
jgi:hypothetical protein